MQFDESFHAAYLALEERMRFQAEDVDRQAGLARKEAIVGREDRFHSFMDSVRIEDVIATAEDVLHSANVPESIRYETLPRLKQFELTESRQRLLFIYKEAFGAMARRPDARP